MQRIYVTIRPLNREDSVLYFPPESFGPFRVLHQIGAGTLGPVFRAYEPAGTHRDRLVAIKVFRLDLTPEQAKALVDELNALVAADISHPNIAAPIAAGLEHGTAYLAQEYAVGDSLDVVLREHGAMSIAEGVELVEWLASAIDHAADRGVHHGALHMRDIICRRALTPASAVVRPNLANSGETSPKPREGGPGAPPQSSRGGWPDAVRLLDGVLITGFGITAALTKIGARRPTRPQYSSPDAPSDVYSLGTIAFEAVAGKRVSPDNLADFEQRHGRELRGAFGVALAANPQMRPDRAGDFAAVLRDAAEMTAEAEINSMAVGGVEDVAAPLAAAPVAAPAPAAAADVEADFDVPIDRAQEMVEPAVIGVQPPDDPMDRLATVDLPPPSAPRWSPAPAGSFSPDLSGEPTSRRWPMVAMLLAFVILAGLSVAFFLRSPVASSSDQAGNAVDETIVDLPKSAPPASTAAPASEKKPQPALEPARSPSPPAAAPSRPASGAVRRSQTGNLLLRTTPADAEVTVNGQPRGKTPLVLRDLALGSYTIRVARDGFASEERTLQLTTRRPTFSTTINLRPAAASAGQRSTSAFAQGASADKPADRPASTGGANTIARGGSAGSASGAAEKSTGGLNVQSRPPGARVFVNDRPAGSTPVAVPGVPAGSATVRIEMDGYEPWIATVNVNAGEQTRVGASLDRK